jgi:ABC-type lipoprotein export system ATPase subunit
MSTSNSHSAPNDPARPLIGSAAFEGPYLLCQDIFKIYKVADLEVVALRGLDLTVERGELVAIVGASGSGKSTLLNLIAGLDQPSAGRCVVAGRDLATLSASDMVEYRRVGVGFVWQQTSRNLLPYLTAEQNVEMPMVLAGASPRTARKHARELLEAVGLSQRVGFTPERLSGGEQQRVAIAVALANNPPLLLADEPTGELDSHTAAEIFALLAELNRRHQLTTVIVTHDPAVAAKVDRTVVIRDGRLSSEIIRRSSFRDDADATHEEYTVVDSAGRLQLPPEYLRSLAIADRVRLLLEPDHVRVYGESEPAP